jgi:hypothetical protein
MVIQTMPKNVSWRGKMMDILSELIINNKMNAYYSIQ